MDKKNRIFPIILTLIILVIVIYLFVNIKQPYIECSNEYSFDQDVVVKEELKSSFSGNKIKEMELTKTVILPEKYQSREYLDMIVDSLEKAYQYLDDSEYRISEQEDRVIINIVVDDDETLLLNNIEFINTDDLQMKINSNTKSSEVITLKINDNYTEGELMKRLKNNDYKCR